MNKQIHISYFAILREQRGLASEEITTSAGSARDLFTELATRHRFTLPIERLRIAIDGEFASWETPLESGAKIAIIPPVAGG